ncbi:MAG: winged helix-turn-helix transcriptional regulator [Firmicutes bacterium]|uniref:Winged helix-turn-helix transcriptional regulator n=1 Tax=Candidatus Scatoplasma merdavium TaxID=2840932 RepID=A0A9D9GRM8_9BACL|nr:winged helix-turn-helix transcriptional regulator [Candidatus Scatoplasma merdavium]
MIENDVAPLVLYLARLLNVARDKVAFKGLELSPQLIRILMTIYALPNATVTDLATKTKLTKATLSKHVSTLVKNDYINKVIDASDHRIERLALSKKGLSYAEDCIARLERMNEEIVSKFSQQKVDQLKSLCVELSKIYIERIEKEKHETCN